MAQSTNKVHLASEQILNIERQTEQKTRNAYRGVEAGVSRVKALQQALKSTQKAAEATKAGFNAGTWTSVELLQAERETFRAIANFDSARYDYITNLLTLKQSAGLLVLADIELVNRWLQWLE